MRRDTKSMSKATVWVQCLKMWKAINCGISKQLWCVSHNYSLVLHCFFCDYAVGQQKHNQVHFRYGSRFTCKYCPAKAVDPKFLCQNKSYHWMLHPDKFYTKLQELNAKRLELNRKNRNRKTE